MSSLIIASHVKDGIKMAKEYNLPQPIVDIIPQHHGTRLITYFYKKAKRHEVSEIQEVSESNFRYPGPKPQGKEAAIFMMADSVEAAARTNFSHHPLGRSWSWSVSFYPIISYGGLLPPVNTRP